jgi:UDP-N-acetylmuramate dehydrogenase
MSAKAEKKAYDMPQVRGRLTENAPLGKVGWFRTGGAAEYLFKPADLEDLQEFLTALPADVPVSTYGVLSNSIIRDGGVRGVVIRLGRDFAAINALDDYRIKAGSLALDANVAKAAASAAIDGLSFYSGIPGTIGGALRMNAGCYGTETKDVLNESYGVRRDGSLSTFKNADMGLSYRHSETPQDVIFTGALFQGEAGKENEILSNMNDIKMKRENAQPIREKTGGSTFANPSADQIAEAGLDEGTKVWQIIDSVGGRGLRIGGAMMSEKHCNFMINSGDASAEDLESLGEEVRRIVHEEHGIMLRWEVRRVGEKKNG